MLFGADALGIGAGNPARRIDRTDHRRACRRACRRLTLAQSVRITGQRGDGNDGDEGKNEHGIGKARAAGRQG